MAGHGRKLPNIGIVQLSQMTLHWPQGATSWVYNYFALTAPAVSPAATLVCLQCGHQKEVGGPTSNMISHLVDFHKLRDLSGDVSQRSLQPVLGAASFAARPKELSPAKKAELNNNLALFVAGDGRALRVVEGKWFVRFVGVLHGFSRENPDPSSLSILFTPFRVERQ
jgi:hypothetical protein